MTLDSITPPHNRLGLHYYPDSLHFREADLKTWLPELASMDVHWLTLLAPFERAIPEPFLNGLLTSKIQPILHFNWPININYNPNSLRLLLHNYARWGIRYVCFFDRPNLRLAWQSSDWAQADLVERFLDILIPIIESAREEGLQPIFPPLEPGGDYWDTAFLKAALRAIKRRGLDALLDSLIIGAYAWAKNRSLTWGAGGFQKWPNALPYYTPPGCQDQQGFFIFDWYQDICQSELGRPLPMVLLRMGTQFGDQTDPNLPLMTAELHAQRNLRLADLLITRYSQSESDVPNSFPISLINQKPGKGTNLPETNPPNREPVSDYVLAANFWLLTTSTNSPFISQAWFKPDGRKLPVVHTWKRWILERKKRLAVGRGEPKNIETDLKPIFTVHPPA